MSKISELLKKLDADRKNIEFQKFAAHQHQQNLIAAARARQHSLTQHSSLQLRQPISTTPAQLQSETEAGNEEFEEAVEEGNSFEEYKPAKLSVGSTHPDPLVQSSSLAAVEPPDIVYTTNFSQKIIQQGLLSSAQLETIVYACQAHESFLPDRSRKGFFLGDGAGVGKGRQLAAIILENWSLQRRKHIWISAHNDLQFDARRDLDDIYASDIASMPLNKLPYEKIKMEDGVIFATYSSLIASSLTKSRRTRLDQLVQWCGGRDFDGCILFDECHRAKNLVSTSGKPTRTGAAVVELQQQLPMARIVYCSATGVTEPANMAYMVRLHLWGPGSPFPSGFKEFRKAVETGGVGMMELLAMHMKRRGLFLCRSLSYSGCDFQTMICDEEDTGAASATPPATLLRIYDETTRLWQELLTALTEGIENRKLIYPIQKLKKAADDKCAGDVDSEEDDEDDDELLVAEDKDRRALRLSAKGKFGSVFRYYWGAHQRFYRSLNISLKVPSAIAIAKQALAQNQSVIIGLQSTGESHIQDFIGSDSKKKATEFFSSPAATLTGIIYK
eukprot:gene31586-42124_t